MKNRKSGDAGMKYDPAQVRIHEAYTVAIRDLGVHGEGIGSCLLYTSPSPRD